MTDLGQDVMINLQLQTGIDTDTRTWVLAEDWTGNGS